MQTPGYIYTYAIYLYINDIPRILLILSVTTWGLSCYHHLEMDPTNEFTMTKFISGRFSQVNKADTVDKILHQVIRGNIIQHCKFHGILTRCLPSTNCDIATHSMADIDLGSTIKS
jgi:hypothetical protein